MSPLKAIAIQPSHPKGIPVSHQTTQFLADAAPDNVPFSQFAPPIRAQGPLRQAITAAYRRPETDACRPW